MTKLLSTDTLRRLALSHQGLTSSNLANGISGTQKVIEHLGYVQIDTISVVERAHHHVLWNRVENYEQSYLNKLVQQQHIFEYWYHAAAYLPMQDYRYTLPQKEIVRNGKHRYFNHGDKKLMHEILTQVRTEGKICLRNIDQQYKKQSGSWWNTSLARRSIEQLFMQGDLVICERIGMEKMYDLTERYISSHLDLSMPTLNEYALYLFTTTLRSHGVFTFKQLLHLKVGKEIREAMQKVVDQHIELGSIIKVKDENRRDYYVNIHSLEAIEKQSRSPLRVKILSPFDNLVIHRDRLNSLFQFDYRLECYVPASKRVFGYFCLPILYGEQVIGRIDCKAYRTKKQFEVINLHLENNHLVDQKAFMSALNIELYKFAHFNQCNTITHRNILDHLSI